MSITLSAQNPQAISFHLKVKHFIVSMSLHTRALPASLTSSPAFHPFLTLLQLHSITPWSHISALSPLHLLFLLPGYLFFQITIWLVLSPLASLYSIIPFFFSVAFTDHTFKYKTSKNPSFHNTYHPLTYDIFYLPHLLLSSCY